MDRVTTGLQMPPGMTFIAQIPIVRDRIGRVQALQLHSHGLGSNPLDGRVEGSAIRPFVFIRQNGGRLEFVELYYSCSNDPNSTLILGSANLVTMTTKGNFRHVRKHRDGPFGR